MKRVPIIDFVRLASIIVVIGDHFYPKWVAVRVSSPFLQQLILTFFQNAGYGVTCFFVVSGFLITQMLMQGREDLSTIDLKGFYVRRAARIVPLLVLTVTIGFVAERSFGLMGPQFHHLNLWKDPTNFGPTFWAALFTFTFNWYLMNHHGETAMHWDVLWSLAVEEQFYFFFPCLLKWMKKRDRVVLFLLFVILGAFIFRFWVGGHIVDGNYYQIRQASFAVFDQIAIGAGLYLVHERWGDWFEKRQGTAFLLILAGTGGCLSIFLGTCYESAGKYIYAPTLLALSCAVAVLGGLHSGLFRSRWAEILSWPGKLSYGCYLLHPTFVALLMPLCIWMGGLESLVFLFLTVFLFAYFSYHFYEVKMNHRVRGWFGMSPSKTE